MRKTHFAPPERLAPDEVLAVASRLKAEHLVSWFDALPVSIIVLNRFRQIVFCNQAFRKLSRKMSPEEAIGLRPGEALDCVHAHLMEAGCGCSQFCSVCGAANAIITSLGGGNDCQECHMVRLEDNREIPLDLQVFTSAVRFAGEEFVLFTAMDISHEKKRGYLERRFFHDMINASGGMVSLMSLLENDQMADEAYAPLIRECSERIFREVLFLRDLTAAEEGRLRAEFHMVSLPQLIGELVKYYAECPEASGVHVHTQEVTGELVTDSRLLRHVLAVLYSNALEAVGKGDTVVWASRECETGWEVALTNPGEISGDLGKKLFKRYVTTKGDDRGLGLFIARRIVRDYLGGDLTFRSDNGRVTFTIRLGRPATDGDCI